MAMGRRLACLAFCLGGLPTSVKADKVGNEAISVELNAERGYRLESITVQGVTFVSGGGFPTFQLFNQQGTDLNAGAQASIFTKTETEKIEGGLRVKYSSEGFAVAVDYQLKKDQVVITVRPGVEKGWKIRGVTDGGALAAIPSNGDDAASGFLLRPYLGGEMIKLTDSREAVSETHPQSWDYDATFVGLGWRDKGLIVRAPQYGAQWTAGTSNIRGIYSLHAGVTMDFRPRRDQPGAYTFWDIGLCEPFLQIELRPVADATGDGKFTWADIGVEYRRQYLRRNAHLDPHIPGSVIGKIDLSVPYVNLQKYDELIREIRQIDYAPQTWWLVGAHTGETFDFVAPPHSTGPDASHNGANGYDYFAFRNDALKVGARVGLHEIFDDTSPLNPDEWNRVPMRIQEYNEIMGTWSCTMADGTKFSAVSKALRPVLADGSFMKELQAHFKQWDVKAGDTWHWDVFTSVSRADFNPKHPVTHGQDFRDRIEVLKQIQKLGIYQTSEGLQEGVSEYCSFAWVSKAAPVLESKFPGSKAVPLMPTLFQGITYYGAPWKAAWGLLMGGDTASEGTMLNLDAIKQGYFGQVTAWGKICDRTVKNMTQTENGWVVEYDQGGTLTVDLAAMTYRLAIDGAEYTNENPPASPLGYTAQWVDGSYKVSPPAAKP